MTLTVQTDYAAMKQAIITWLSTYPGGLNDVIFKNQAAPRPAKPYASILVTSNSNKYGFDDVTQGFDAANQVITRQVNGLRTMIVQIEVFTDPATDINTLEAREYLEGTLDALESQPVRDLFRNAGLGVLRFTPPNQLDEQLGERWERRAQTDLTFTYTASILDDGSNGSGDWIETFETPTESNGNATFNP